MALAFFRRHFSWLKFAVLSMVALTYFDIAWGIDFFTEEGKIDPSLSYWLKIAASATCLVALVLILLWERAFVFSKTVFGYAVPFISAVSTGILYHEFQNTTGITLFGETYSGPAILRNVQFSDSYKDPFYSAVSTLYALIIAGALAKGISDFDALKKTISAEVNTIESIIDWLKHMTETGSTNDLAIESTNKNVKVVRNFMDKLCLYVINVSKKRDRERDTNSNENSRLIEGCRELIKDLRTADDEDKIARPRLMVAIDRLSRLRTERRSSEGLKFPRYLFFILFLMSIFLILPFIAEPRCVTEHALLKRLELDVGRPSDTEKIFDLKTSLKSFCVQTSKDGGEELYRNPQLNSQYFMIGVMAFFFSFLIMTLLDIGTPYEGFWLADFREFIECREKLMREIGVLDKRIGEQPAEQS